MNFDGLNSFGSTPSSISKTNKASNDFSGFSVSTTQNAGQSNPFDEIESHPTNMMSFQPNLLKATESKQSGDIYSYFESEDLKTDVAKASSNKSPFDDLI
jgi:hypothetical protein